VPKERWAEAWGASSLDSTTPLLCAAVVCTLPLQSTHRFDGAAGRRVSRWRDRGSLASTSVLMYEVMRQEGGRGHGCYLVTTAEPQLTKYMCWAWPP
jgi:hypothetical protein